MSFAEATCLPMVGSAALTTLTVKSKIKEGDLIFVAGCTGGVSHHAVQVAKDASATVLGSCHKDDFAIAKLIRVDEVCDDVTHDRNSIYTCQIVVKSHLKKRDY